MSAPEKLQHGPVRAAVNGVAVAVMGYQNLASVAYPQFGGPEWLALDEGDPRRIASMAHAAWNYWRYHDPLEIERQLRDELNAERALAEMRERKHAEDDQYAEDQAAHRDTWGDEVQRAPGRYAESNVVFLAGRQR